MEGAVCAVFGICAAGGGVGRECGTLLVRGFVLRVLF